MRLSPNNVAFYERTGWFVSEYVLTDAEISAGIDAAERIYRCDYDRVPPWSSSPLLADDRKPYLERTRLRVDQFPSFHNDTIRGIVQSSAIAEIAAQLLRTNGVRYYKDILIGTPTERSDSSIGWHTDISYWPTCVAERMITVYIPLQARGPENGTLLMINGSQTWGKRAFNLTAGFDELPRLKQRFEAAGYRVELQALPHRRGQVSFHSSLVVHATYPNVTREFQHSIVFGLQASDNRFVPSPLKRFASSVVVNLNDEIGPHGADGLPDLGDDSFYPVLYRARGA